ncbi:hypothetical protein IQ16_07603 [Bradyrhizobium huanghuaihaiense]|uniref:Apea-like HEPN domain-containing protein n=1 Tax=Bradyrhizobium huanghuaihaiense TaxID=990078 RepID=A0A562QV19_9BRAD|nr:hypothetical protein [Bradyrhizobium huanghuaihaiense]TWI60483.1 hypothetical protein IQ16_07603 [Bradyrhizobium huanghuaihaiense]
MRPTKYAWPTSDEGRSVKFCAQLFNEMLGEYSFESFRVYALDTLSRLSEALTLLDDVQRDRVPRETLEPVVEEVLWSLGRDPVAKSTVGLELVSLQELTKQPKFLLTDLVATVQLIKRLLVGSYKSRLEARILDLLTDGSRKIELRQCCGFYSSHLINAGYSKQYLEEMIEATFFSGDMQHAGTQTLADFFARLKGDDVDYTVYTPVSSEFRTYVYPLGFETANEFNIPQPARDALAFAFTPPFDSVIISRVKAVDWYRAINDVHQVLTHTRALTYLSPDGMACRWQEWMYVHDDKANWGRAFRGRSLSFDRPAAGSVTAGRRLQNTRAYTKRVLENFDNASTERLLSSINTAALARTSPSTENQLISLWSAVEVLLSDPPRGAPRILHYVHHLVPCICLRHVRRQFVAVYEELLVSYRSRLNKILRREANFGNQDAHTNFAAVLCLQENEALREELCALCGDNPLALHRLFKLHRDYSVSMEAAAAIGGHEKRVQWQIHRIYRARNQLVHSGRVPSYLQSLILNLFEYYRGSIATIVNRARKDEQRSNIDQVVAEIGVEYGIFKRHFPARGAKPLSREDLQRLVGVAP